jgi:hypothetical protein
LWQGAPVAVSALAILAAVHAYPVGFVLVAVTAFDGVSLSNQQAGSSVVMRSALERAWHSPHKLIFVVVKILDSSGSQVHLDRKLVDPLGVIALLSARIGPGRKLGPMLCAQLPSLTG